MNHDFQAFIGPEGQLCNIDFDSCVNCPDGTTTVLLSKVGQVNTMLPALKSWTRWNATRASSKEMQPQWVSWYFKLN